MILLSLILDDEHGALNLQLWSIYYHLYLDDASLELLGSQASKLSGMATSMESWHDGKYGQQLRFCDGSTMKRVRELWNTYCLPKVNSPEHEPWVQRANLAIQRAMKSRKARVGKSSSVFSGLRSAAPAGINAFPHAPKLGQHFWDHGTTDGKRTSASGAGHVNPMFVTYSSTLHYGTDPLLGFHLATAYIPLEKKSPLQSTSMRDKKLPFKVVEAARAQFEAWAKAFRQSSMGDTVIRFFAGDAVNFSYALQHANAIKLKSVNIPHDSYHLDPIVLYGLDYAEGGNGPLQFNVIDTSNLIDHLGSVNLLVSVTPLLCNSKSSSLFTESMVRQDGSLQDYADSLLCGHLPTMSTLMGLFPVEFWANTSPYSTVDDLILESNFGTDDDTAGMRQRHVKLTWKQTTAGLVSHTPTTRKLLRLDELGLARVLHKMYLNMFRHENAESLLSNVTLQSLSKHSMPRYHRGSFALVLRFVRSRVTTNWDVMMNHLLGLIEVETTVMMGLNYIQELYLYLHLYDVFSASTFSVARMQLEMPQEGRLRNWKSIPSVMCVTLVVPREKVEVITNVDTRHIGSPIMHCLIQSSSSSRSQRWQNIFSVITVSFGKLAGTGTSNAQSFSIAIEEDELRWRGRSSLIASFMVPTWTLLLEPRDAKIAFGIQGTPAAIQTFLPTLGMEMNIFETVLGDETNVFFSRFPPNQNDTCSLLPIPSPDRPASYAGKPVASSEISANLDSATCTMTTLTCRLDILSDDVREALKSGGAVQTSQRSLCTFLENVGPTCRPITFDFPAPVVRLRSKTRIARKSMYIEVEAPLANATAWKSFPAHLYPVCLSQSTPLSWNMPRLNLDCLPIIDVSKKTEMHWLNMHTSGMFNTRERRLRTRPTSASGENDVRSAFRESLFKLFMLFTGLQGRKSHVATLNNPTGGGAHVIILINSLKLDQSNRTVVLDCAVLPLTDALMPRLGPFLSILSRQQICHIKVDADELQLWKQNLPAMVERCRSWPHQARCEYRIHSRIPLSTEDGQAVVCTCGSGKLPANFIANVPHWSSVSKHFVRTAISLCFSTGFSEQLFDLNTFREKLLNEPKDRS